MKSGYLVHVIAVITLALGVWIVVDKIGTGDNGDVTDELAVANKSTGTANDSRRHVDQQSADPAKSSALDNDPESGKADDSALNLLPAGTDANAQPDKKPVPENIEPDEVLHQYLLAWQNQSKAELDQLWEQIKNCDKCLALFVEQIVARKFEEGLELEIAIKMAALDSNIVMPVFDVLIDPAGTTSTAIILSEKLINNGRPEFVNKVFDLIYRANQSGYHHFSQQLTWVISKLENPRGIEPILDTITGRTLTSPELSTHITSVYSKVVRVLPEESKAGAIISNYYMQANSREQQLLWPVVRQHGDTLVKLAVQANENGQNFNVQKYAEAMTDLPHLNAVDALMKLHTAVEYSPAYMSDMLSKRVADNPTIKVLHKLEDYMRNPLVKLESRLFAAEGLLAVRQNREARYILDKVINSTHEPDAELQAFIAGRL